MRADSRKAAAGLVVTLSILAAACSGVENEDAETTDAGALSVDELLSIQSAAGGREGHVWAPDGSAITFASGGRLVAVDPTSGRRRQLGVDMGGAGHFLAYQKPRYSPDGEWISYISVKTGAQELWLWSESEWRDLQLTNLGARINSYNWSPDGRWIAFAGDRHGTYDIWKVEVATGDVYRLTSDRRYEVFPYWTPDSRSILYVRLDEAWVDHDVIGISAENGETWNVVGDTDFFDYQSGGKFGYPMVSPDGSQVLFRSHRSGWINYWVVPVEGGEPRRVAPEDADQSDAQWSPDGSRIAFTSNVNGTHTLRVADLNGGGVTELVSPGEMGVVSNPAWSPDGASVSYGLETPTQPRDLYVVSVADGATTRLTTADLDQRIAARLLEPEKIHYGSTDGYVIPAYLYRPREITPGQRLPGLLWIHGGPTSQFHDTFQQHVQFFAQQGYVVLMPNIRGSSGYGKAFEEGNMRCWGRCDLEDVLAGVDHLKELPYIDPHNIGITGTSYGGIMSMAAPTFAPGVFQAAIPIAGYADYEHFMEEQEYRHIQLLKYELGPWPESRELYRHLSPINFVPDITTPFLVIHGAGFFPESDASRNFVNELQRHYKPFEYRVYPDENYYVRSRENRRQMLLDMLDFLDRNLRGNRIVGTFPPAAEGLR